MAFQRATGKYQLLDPLSSEDFAALEADILERGVMVPIEFDEDGNVIDGYHRHMICQKHGIKDFPSIVRKGWTEEQKRTHARRMNLARRQLNRDQRRRLIEDELRESPDATNRKIAAALGVDHKTVGSVRERLEADGEIPQVEARTGIDGTTYIRTPTRRSHAPKTDPPVDADGRGVPNHLAGVFQAVADFAALQNELTEIKRRMLKLGEKCGPMKEAKHLVRRHIDQLQGLLGKNVPHAVHQSCKGKGCDGCGSRGYTIGGEIPQVGEDG